MSDAPKLDNISKLIFATTLSENAVDQLHLVSCTKFSFDDHALDGYMVPLQRIDCPSWPSNHGI